MIDKVVLLLIDILVVRKEVKVRVAFYHVIYGFTSQGRQLNNGTFSNKPLLRWVLCLSLFNVNL